MSIIKVNYYQLKLLTKLTCKILLIDFTKKFTYPLQLYLIYILAKSKSRFSIKFRVSSIRD
jgi:hypothetical protein